MRDRGAFHSGTRTARQSRMGGAPTGYEALLRAQSRNFREPVVLVAAVFVTELNAPRRAVPHGRLRARSRM